MELLATDDVAEPVQSLDVLVSELVDSGRLVYLDSPLTSKKDPTRQELGAKYLGLLGPIPLPITVHGVGRRIFQWYIFARFFGENPSKNLKSDGPISSVLTYHLGRKAQENEIPLVRLHSACHTGDILGSMRCDCGPQFHESLKRIVEHKEGVLVYNSSHEGRGIGLWAKALAYILQDRGCDTYRANELLGFPVDARDYRDSVIVLKHLLGGKKKDVILLSNNPQKKMELEAGGLKVVEMRKLIAGVNECNMNYIVTKIRGGHTISSLDLGPH